MDLLVAFRLLEREFTFVAKKELANFPVMGPLFKMADVSRHKRMDTLRGYVRDTEVFKNHAGEGLL